MAKKGKKKKTVVPPIVDAPPGSPEATFTAVVIHRFQEVCELWAEGKSMAAIALELGLRGGTQLRDVIKKDRALRVVLDEYTQLRADFLFEKAVTWGVEMGDVGSINGNPQAVKIGIDAAFKAAAQLAPKTYGDVKKTEMRDGAGRLIGTETTTTLSPGEAYERMLKGE
jgi:hypothetical protein